MTTGEDRLQRFCESSRRVAAAPDLGELLAEAARGAQQVCNAETCAVQLRDGRRHALRLSRNGGSQRADCLADVRFRDRSGVAMRVASDGQPRLIDDLPHDARFRDVACSSDVRSVLCVPLLTASGVAGVLELTDPRPGHFTARDREVLEALAANLAVAYEKVLLAECVHRDLIGPRQLGMFTAVGLIASGLALVGGATFTSLALALPLSALPNRPGMWSGLVCTVAGVVLLRLVHRVGASRAARRIARPPMTARLENAT